MFMLQDSGEVSKHLKAFFFKMSKLRLLHLRIMVPKYPHRSLSTFECEKQGKYEQRNSWVLLPHLYFQH